ncbi:protein TCL1B4-like [Mus pahari]|uniref:protein TCL1B4-like n=1 Tax=Mus pahari TaxID=10093 RepID=UPI000A305ADB|nr:protein TCL1B4-like [Mus pahari]
MAAALRPPWLPFPPRFLVCTREDIYEDENGRQWVVAKVETCSNSPCGNRIGTYVTVHLCQMTTLPREPSPDSFRNLNYLPTMWSLKSTSTYWGSDSMHWRLLNHYQFNGPEELILMLESR